MARRARQQNWNRCVLLLLLLLLVMASKHFSGDQSKCHGGLRNYFHWYGPIHVCQCVCLFSFLFWHPTFHFGTRISWLTVANESKHKSKWHFFGGVPFNWLTQLFQPATRTSEIVFFSLSTVWHTLMSRGPQLSYWWILPTENKS